MAEKKTRTERTHKSFFPEEAREHARAARREMRASFYTLFPPEFVEHRRKAGKEMLLAWRSVLDSAIEHIEEREKTA